DLQGKPIAGVTVKLRELYWPKKGDLGDFHKALKERKDGYPVQNEYLAGVGGWIRRDFAQLVSATTGPARRFQLKGIGRERVAALRLEGPTIETRDVSVLTRRAETIRVPEYARNRDGGTLTYHGTPFEHAAAPTKPVVGVVRDKDTGK